MINAVKKMETAPAATEATPRLRVLPRNRRAEARRRRRARRALISAVYSWLAALALMAGWLAVAYIEQGGSLPAGGIAAMACLWAFTVCSTRAGFVVW